MSGTKAGAQKRRQTQPESPVPTPEARAESRPERPSPPVYVVGRNRSLMHQGKRLEAGEVVEGAHLWVRIESWIAAGRVEIVK